MTERDENPFPQMDVIPHPLRRLRELGHLVFAHHAHSSSSGHSHPLDAEVAPVTDWPLESDGVAPNQMVDTSDPGYEVISTWEQKVHKENPPWAL